jgi:hypothetical protein
MGLNNRMNNKYLQSKLDDFLTILKYLIVLMPLIAFSKNYINENSYGPFINEYKFDTQTNLSSLRTNFPGEPLWIWADLGRYIGSGLLDSADFDGDGSIEVITIGVGVPSIGSGVGPSTIYILKEDLTTISCLLDIKESFIYDYHIQQLDQDNALEIILVTDTEIIAMDGKDCLIQAQYSFPHPISAAGIGDVNNDNIADIAYSNGNDLYVAEWNDLSNSEEMIGMGGYQIVIESIGREGGDDIGVGQADSSLKIIQGNTLQLISSIPNAGYRFVFGDLSGQGEYKVIASTNSINIAIYDIQTGNIDQLLNFDFQNEYIIKTKDIDNDGHEEIIVGYRNGPDYLVFNEFGNIIHDIEVPSSGVYNLHIVDFEGGLGSELLLSVGRGNTGTDILYRINLLTEQIVWESTNLFGPYQLSSMGKYFANNQDYLAVSFNRSQETFDTGGVAILNTTSGNQNSIIIPNESANSGDVTAVATANIDNDPQWEICIAYDLFIDNYIMCKDSLTQEIQWNRQLQDNFEFDVYYINIFDIDDDSNLELVLVDREGIVRVYNASNGFLKWQSIDLSNNNISWGFNGVSKIGSELWISFPWGEIYKLNAINGDVLDHYETTAINQIISDGDILYAIKDGEGLGILNPLTLEFSETLYSTTDTLTYLDISDDNELLFTASGDIPILKPVLVSTNNKFTPWSLGDVLIYDTHMPDDKTLFLATTHGAQKLNLENIFFLFKNGFE